MTKTMRERLALKITGMADVSDGHAERIVDAILEELRAEAGAPRADHEGIIYEMARAIGLQDSGTDLEAIASGRGSYEGYMDCARSAFTAMIDAIRKEET